METATIASLLSSLILTCHPRSATGADAAPQAAAPAPTAPPPVTSSGSVAAPAPHHDHGQQASSPSANDPSGSNDVGGGSDVAHLLLNIQLGTRVLKRFAGFGEFWGHVESTR